MIPPSRMLKNNSISIELVKCYSHSTPNLFIMSFWHRKLFRLRLRYKTHGNSNTKSSGLDMMHMLVFKACKHYLDVHPDRKWQVMNRIAPMLLLSLTADHVYFNQTFGESINLLFNLRLFSAQLYKPSHSTFSLNQSSVLPRGQNEKLFRKIMGIRLQCAGLLYKLQVKGKYHRATDCNNTECGTLKKTSLKGQYTPKQTNVKTCHHAF